MAIMRKRAFAEQPFPFVSVVTVASTEDYSAKKKSLPAIFTLNPVNNILVHKGSAPHHHRHQFTRVQKSKNRKGEIREKHQPETCSEVTRDFGTSAVNTRN